MLKNPRRERQESQTKRKRRENKKQRGQELKGKDGETSKQTEGRRRENRYYVADQGGERGWKPSKAPAFRSWKAEGNGFFPEPPQGL